MKKIIVAIALFALALGSSAQTIQSPSGNLSLNFSLEVGGKPTYSLSRGESPVILPSGMGFKLRSSNHVSKIVIAEDGSISKVYADADYDLTSGFVPMTDVAAISAFDETWKTVWGEEESIRNNYNELSVRLRHKASGRIMTIRFRLYDDGLGFRYEFEQVPGVNDFFIVADECTEFALAGDHKAWWIPGDYDSQEYEYCESRLSEIPQLLPGRLRANDEHSPFSIYAVQTSLQMKTDEGLYINLHEAALKDYSCMHLQLIPGTTTFVSALTPNPEGDMAVMQAPAHTPWRTVQVAESGARQLQSRLVLNLNEPCAYKDVSWIHPTKYIGVWWEMISGRGSWSSVILPDTLGVRTSTRIHEFDYAKAEHNPLHGATTENVKKYIDYAAANGFDEVLVEGWNIGWEDWDYYLKDEVFDFVTPAPDFDIKELNNYAHRKHVKLMMHHETASSIRNYERHMGSAYQLMCKYGYDAVKSGYVSDVFPRGEYRFGQATVNHFLYAVTEAAKHKIMVNAHEAVRPTGLCRTYPNMIGNESAMGTEYQSFMGITPGHVTILPFTRLNGGPMDYTPGIFEMDLSVTSNGRNNHHVLATICNQLALYLTLYSPLQMAADLPENYDKFPDAFQFIKDVPVDWSESRYLDAEIGDYVIVARKGRKDGKWYVGGVTDGEQRTVSINLDFLPAGKKYNMVVYRDGEDAHYLLNPQSYDIVRDVVTPSAKLDVTMAPGGGFVAKFEELDDISIVPQPVSFTQNGGVLQLKGKFGMWTADESLSKLIDTYIEFTSGDNVPTPFKASADKKAKVFLCLDAEFEPEEYVLEADKSGIRITGGSEKGVWWGLQTMLQVMSQTTRNGVCKYPCMTVQDAPMFSYRGAHLDCSRHFFKVSDVKKYIDMMAIHKLNTFHWHLTDNEGWRIEIKSYPNLTRIGSCRPETVVGHYYRNMARPEQGIPGKYDGIPVNGYYTQSEAREIVAYAAARQITVIPEIESPGHCLAALASYPNLGCKGTGYEVGKGEGAVPDNFCPGKESTFEFMEKVIDELCTIFPSEYIHIGGDEVKTSVWATCPDCRARMESLGLTEVGQLQNYFVKRVEEYIIKQGRTMIGWDEILDGGVSKNAVVMSWRGAKGGIKAAQLGNDVIMSPSSHFYFDHPQYSDNSDALDMVPGDYRRYSPITNTYSFNPFEGLDPDQRKHILGLQCNLWTELIPDMAQLQKMALPRMAALAECAWGTKTTTSNFLSRVEMSMMPLYRQRGYNPAELYK